MVKKHSFTTLILSTLNFKKWTLRKIRPTIDTTMDQQKSLHHHKLSDGSLHKILVNKQAVQELHANIEESKLMLIAMFRKKLCFIFQSMFYYSNKTLS